MSSTLARFISATLLAFRSHVQRRARGYSALVSWGPYLCGPLIILVSPSEVEFVLALKRYAAVLILFLAWEMLLRAAVHVRSTAERQEYSRREQSAQETRRSKRKRDAAPTTPGGASTTLTWSFTTIDKVKIAAATLIILLTLELFRGYFKEVVFLIVLGTFSCGALARFLQRHNPLRAPRYLLSLTPQLLYLTGIGYLTCIAMSGDFFQQPAVVSASIAAMAMTPGLLAHLIALDAAGASVAPERPYLIRALELLVCTGPVAIALLVYGHQLATPYMLVLLAFIPGGRLLRQLPRKDPSEMLRPELQWLGAATGLTYLAILTLLRVL